MIGNSGTIERLIITGQGSDTVSKPNEGKLIYDRNNQCFATSENGGPYGCLSKGGSGGSFAPIDATYITQTPNATLTNEQALSLLGTGALINTTGTGVLSIYGGASCTNQFIRALNPSITATCSSVSLTSDVTGTLAIANGGTGQTTASAAFNALSPMTTLGDIIYGGSSGSGTRLAGNTTTTRKFLRQVGNGVSSSAPDWDTITAADVPGSALTKFDDTNVTLTLGGSPNTALLNAASITVGWTGQLSVPRGGTGASSISGLVLGNGTSAMTAYGGTSCSNQFPRSLNASGVATCNSVSLTDDVTGILGVANGGTGSSSFTAGSIIFSDGSILTQNNAELFWDNANKRLGIGTTSLTGKVGISASRTETDLNADPAEVLISTTWNPSGTGTGSLIGTKSSVDTAGAQNLGRIIGFLSSPSHSGTGTLSNLYGIYSTPTVNSGAGPVTNIISMYFITANSSTSTVTNMEGVRIDINKFTSGPVTNAKALYIRSGFQGVTGTKHGIYVEDTNALNYFGGNVGLATTSPTQLLSLGGNAARTIWMERHTTANTAGNSLTIQAGGATVGATDKAAGDLILAPGISTGNQGGKVQIQSTLKGASGTTDHNPVTHFQITQGHIETLGTAPTLSAGCGTGATIVGNDNNGTITTNATSFGTCTVTFARAWTNVPQCVLNNRSSAGVTRVTSPSTTAFTVTGATGGDIIDYSCRGQS
jgi:hypothetical protein